MTKITSTVVHKQTEQLQIVDTSAQFIPFTLWGAIHTDMNIVDIMVDMTKPEQRVFQELVSCLNERIHESTLPQIPTSQSNKRSSIMKKLIDKGLVKKCGQRTWMINPTLLVPVKEIRKVITAKWESL